MQQKLPNAAVPTLPSISRKSTVHSVFQNSDFHTKVKINDVSVLVHLDSGASINIIDNATFRRLSLQKSIHLTKTNIKLFAYGSTKPLGVKGSFEASVELSNKISVAKFYVVHGTGGCLLSGKSAIDLELIKVNLVSKFLREVSEQKNITHSSDTKKRPKRLGSLFSKYDHLFQGVGKLKDYKVHLHIDKSIPPTVQAARRVPLQ